MTAAATASVVRISRSMNSPNRRWPARVKELLAARGHLLALAAVLGLALFLRIYGIHWDQGGLYHPDERAILTHVYDLKFPKDDLGSLFSAESSLNPKWFPYGSLPLYLLKLVAYIAPPWFENPDLGRLATIGRATSAVFDAFTILIVYLIGARLFNRWAGLLGAGIIALSVLHIQQSHFFVTDIMLATWLVAAFLFLSKAMDSGRAKHFAIAGLFFGLALATKVSAAPFALAFVAAAASYVWKNGSRDPALRGRLAHGAKVLVLAGAVTLLTFAIAQPYGLIDWGTFWGDVREQSEMVRRVRDYPYTRQYADTTPYLYHVRQLTVWGMGLPAGLLLWAGLAGSLGLALWKRDRAHILLLSWIVPYLLITGRFDVKFMRYMIPVTPFLALAAAGASVQAVGWLRARRRTLLRPELGYAVLAAVMVLTLLYAVAYVRVYARPHPAEAASDWIRAHVPAQSFILQDSGWEEGFRRLEPFNQFRMEVYDDDTPRKRQVMIDGLARADYLLFYSNRQYGTIPRLPSRYPLTSAYYELLFSGRLGYELVHWESSYPNLFGLSLADDTFGRPGLPKPPPLQGRRQTARSLSLGYADESFTVYDHPLVLVFQKTVAGSPAERRAFFERTLPEVSGFQSDASQGFGLLLSPEEARRQQEGGTWSDLFDRGSWVNRVPAVVWLAVVQIAFLLALPITLTLFRRLPDRGYLLGKMLAVLLLAYIPWLLASLDWLSFSRGSVALALILMAIASGVVLRRRWRDLLDFFRSHKRLIVASELLFLVAFLGLYGIRVWNPDLWHPYRGGEKPMDFAYFNAVVRSSSMPPYDPWFAGGYLNYYYFGQFMSAAITKLTGIMPSIAINLAVPLFFALAAGGVFSIVYNLTALAKRRMEQRPAARVSMPSPILAGVVGVVLVLVAGNMDGIVQLFQGTERTLSGEHFRAFDFWRSSRMMPSDIQGITEFPYFTFLFADPHAHLFVIPLTLLALGLMLAVILEAPTRRGGPWHAPASLLPLALLGLTLGAILATNSWDVITYAIIGAAAIVIGEYAARRALSWPFVIGSVLKVALLAGLAALFFLPYLTHYEAPIAKGSDSLLGSVPLIGGALSAVKNTFNVSDYQTAPWRYLAVHALFITVLVSFLGYLLWRPRLVGALRPAPGSATLGLQAAAGVLGWARFAYVAGALALVAAAAATGYGTIAMLTAVLALLLPLAAREAATRREGMAERLLLYVVIAAPLLLGILVDLFTFTNDVGRMNTVFKFYLQAWVLMGIATAYALWRLRFGRALAPRALRWGWQASVALLAACVLIYPIMATPVRARDRFDPSIGPSANGMSYMDTAVYGDLDGRAALELRWDRQGIEWLQDNVRGSPVIVEGITPLYRWGNRVSVYTGLPAVIGWDWHQKQQRWDYQWAVDQRRREVDEFFRTPSAGEARRFLERYHVRYVYVGQLERAYYPAGGLAKLDAMVGRGLAVAYENPQVRIYAVTP